MSIRRAILRATMIVALGAGPAFAQPTFSIGRKGFGFESSDGASSLYTHWLVAADFQTFFGKLPPGVTVRDAFVVRSATLQLDAVLHRYVHSQISVDFAQGRTTLFEAWVQLEPTDALKFRAGKFRFPINEERLTTPLNLPFVGTSFASVLLPSADVGLQLFGTVGQGMLAYNLALTNGAVAGTPLEGDIDSSKDLVGRVFVRPFQATEIAPLASLGLGVGASTGRHTARTAAPALPVLRTYGGQTFFAYRSDGTPDGTAIANGRVTRIVPHATWSWGPVAAYADLVRVDERVDTTSVRTYGWSVIPSVVLTGERAAPLSFIVPAHPFDPAKGHFGTVLVTGGVGAISVDERAFERAADPTLAMRKATVVGGGANWYPYAGIAVLASYGYMWFAAAGDAPARPAEHTMIVRLEMAL